MFLTKAWQWARDFYSQSKISGGIRLKSVRLIRAAANIGSGFVSKARHAQHESWKSWLAGKSFDRIVGQSLLESWKPHLVGTRIVIKTEWPGQIVGRLLSSGLRTTWQETRKHGKTPTSVLSPNSPTLPAECAGYKLKDSQEGNPNSFTSAGGARAAYFSTQRNSPLRNKRQTLP